MAHHCEYVDRIEIEYDYETERRYLVRIVNARYKENKLDVMKEIEPNVLEGEPVYYYRNIEFSNMGGYLVSFPGEVYRYRYSLDKYTVKIEDWQDCSSKFMLYCSNIIDDRSAENIIEVYPSFKYVLNKMKPDDKRIERIFELLQVWKKHPEIEGLCQLGFYEIALNGHLFKLTPPKRKQIIKWIMEHKDVVEHPQYMKLVHIQKMIKYKVSIDEYIDWDSHHPIISSYSRHSYNRTTWNCDIPTFFYLKKQGFKDYRTQEIARLYHDYINMAKQAGHDMTDKYWLYPSDINKAHAKVMDELANLKLTASVLQGDYLKAVMQPLADKFNAKVDGYDIFLPIDIDTIKKQCDDLRQCLLRNNYVNNVLMQEEILVFIWKDGKPQATAQVFYDKEVGQFYADESGHSKAVRWDEKQVEHFNKIYHEEEQPIDETDKENYKRWFIGSCKPDIKVYRAFYKWLSTFEPYKVKTERKKEEKIRYYKGFHSVDKKGVYHTSFGNYSFEVGKTYNTNFGDNEILAKGESCMATNKVFHFCKNINDIDRYYSPTCYAEVEPLGPVIQNDGAYLSNKIKIIRALDPIEVEALKSLEILKAQERGA